MEFEGINIQIYQNMTLVNIASQLQSQTDFFLIIFNHLSIRYYLTLSELPKGDYKLINSNEENSIYELRNEKNDEILTVFIREVMEKLCNKIPKFIYLPEKCGIKIIEKNRKLKY